MTLKSSLKAAFKCHTIYYIFARAAYTDAYANETLNAQAEMKLDLHRFFVKISYQ